MKITVDALGCACPEPVIKTKKAMSGGASELVVLVDNKVAFENVKRLAKKNNYQVEGEEKNGIFELNLSKV